MKARIAITLSLGCLALVGQVAETSAGRAGGIAVGKTVLLAPGEVERLSPRGEPGSQVFARRLLQQADQAGHLRFGLPHQRDTQCAADGEVRR